MAGIIKIADLSKRFGRQQAVQNLSFEVNEGEIFAFLGSNGSGKTTTIRCLLGIYTPDSGTLTINGKAYDFSMSHLIGYLPEERGIYTRAKVEELFIYFGNLRGISTDDARSKARVYLERVGLLEHKDKQISQLSSGMQQKVQLGLAMQHNPQLLILDEPFKGLDPLNRQLFIDLFRELRKEGKTIMYSTHVIDEAQKLTDRLVIIDKGERKAYGKTDDVRKEHGSNHIHLAFSGELPEMPQLFSATVTGKTAEIIPAKNTEPNRILQELLKQGLEITSYNVDYPSLNEVFISVTSHA